MDKKAKKPEIGYDMSRYQFTKDNVPISQEEAKAAWEDVGSCDWSVKAYSVMAAEILA